MASFCLIISGYFCLKVNLIVHRLDLVILKNYSRIFITNLKSIGSPHSNLRKHHGIRTDAEVNVQCLAKDTVNHYKKQLTRNTLDPKEVLIKHQLHKKLTRKSWRENIL